MTSTDTKAHWKRRALRAEAELETMRKIRAVDNSMELKPVSENAALRIAIDEISELLDDLSFSLPGDKL